MRDQRPRRHHAGLTVHVAGQCKWRSEPAGAGAQDRAYWLKATSAAQLRPEVRTFTDWLVGKARLLQQQSGAKK